MSRKIKIPLGIEKMLNSNVVIQALPYTAEGVGSVEAKYVGELEAYGFTKDKALACNRFFFKMKGLEKVNINMDTYSVECYRVA